MIIQIRPSVVEDVNQDNMTQATKIAISLIRSRYARKIAEIYDPKNAFGNEKILALMEECEEEIQDAIEEDPEYEPVEE